MRPLSNGVRPLLRATALGLGLVAVLLTLALGALFAAGLHDALAAQGYWFGCLPHSHTCLYLSASDVSVWNGP